MSDLPVVAFDDSVRVRRAAAGLAVGAFEGGVFGAATIDRRSIDEATASMTTTLLGEVEEAASRAPE